MNRIRTFASIPLLMLKIDPIVLASLLLLSTAFMNPAPQDIGLCELAYAGLFYLMMYNFTLRLLVTKGGIAIAKSHLYIPTFFAFLFLALSSVHGIIGNQVDPYLWLRGVAPIVNYLLFFVVLVEVRSKRDIWLLIYALLASALIIVAQHVIRTTSLGVSGLSAMRFALSKQAFQPHVLASFAFLLGYMCEIPMRKRLGPAVLALLFLGFMLVTLSRSLIGISFLLVIAAFLKGSKNPVAIIGRIVGVFFLISLLLMIAFNIDATDSSWLAALSSRFRRDVLQDVRLEELAAVLKEFRKHPVLGNGLGYQYTYYRSSIDLRWQGGYTHNIVTYILLTTGIGGLSIFAWLLGALISEIRWTFKSIRMRSDQKAKACFWGLTFSLAATLLYSLFQSVFRGFSFSIIICFAVGGVIALRKSHLKQEVNQE